MKIHVALLVGAFILIKTYYKVSKLNHIHSNEVIRLNLKATFLVFKNKSFKKAAFGYFGHMWELYTFWAFVPILLASFSKYHAISSLNISLLSFVIIGIGSLSCIFGGFWTSVC